MPATQTESEMIPLGQVAVMVKMSRGALRRLCEIGEVEGVEFINNRLHIPESALPALLARPRKPAQQGNATAAA